MHVRGRTERQSKRICPLRTRTICIREPSKFSCTSFAPLSIVCGTGVADGHDMRRRWSETACARSRERQRGKRVIVARAQKTKPIRADSRNASGPSTRSEASATATPSFVLPRATRSSDAVSAVCSPRTPRSLSRSAIQTRTAEFRRDVSLLYGVKGHTGLLPFCGIMLAVRNLPSPGWVGASHDLPPPPLKAQPPRIAVRPQDPLWFPRHATAKFPTTFCATCTGAPNSSSHIRAPAEAPRASNARRRRLSPALHK